jgi:hypothetical protein
MNERKNRRASAFPTSVAVAPIAHLGDLEAHRSDVLARQAADLIERREEENALRKSKEQFRWIASIVEFSDDAIVSKNLDSSRAGTRARSGCLAIWPGRSSANQ